MLWGLPILQKPNRTVLEKMKFKDTIWDYPEPLKDEMWRARRIAEFFPFVLKDLSAEEKEVVLKHLGNLNVPDERKELIGMVFGGEHDTD